MRTIQVPAARAGDQVVERAGRQRRAQHRGDDWLDAYAAVQILDAIPK
jgi:hypothetical protein